MAIFEEIEGFECNLNKQKKLSNKEISALRLPSKSSHTLQYAAVFRATQALKSLLLYNF